MKKNIKIFSLFILLISGYIEAQNFCPAVTTQGNIAAYWGDTASNRFANTPQSSVLAPYYSSTNISNVTYGSGTNGTALNGTTLNGGTAVSFYNISGVVSTPNGSKYSSFSFTTTANAPLMKVQNYYVAPLAAASQNNLNFSARLIVVDPDTGSDVQVAADKAITTSDPNILPNITYLMMPGKTYQFKLYVWNPNGQTNVYMDNPNFYVSPIPNVNPPSSLCLSNVSGTVSSALASYVVSATPSGMQLRWLNSSAVVSGSNPIAADTYTPYYYDTTSLCYYPAGSSITVTANPSGVSVAPATQTVVNNGTATNLTATATGATSYQWYSNTTNSNAGGTIISGANSSIYTPPTSVLGTFYYYVVAINGGSCGTTSNVARVTVIPCAAGTTAPVLTNGN